MSEPNSRLPIGEANFSVSARVAMQLGRESISNSVVAILELVKNAYDADAEKVGIHFGGLNTQSSIMIIDDDGNGMTKKQFRDNWMVIGTNNKQVLAKSKTKKRILTGEKGLGRLGLDRLSRTTVLQTFPRGYSYGIEVEINWEKYENTTERLEKITHKIYRIPREVRDPISGRVEKKGRGTRLILYGLKDSWELEDLQRLHRQLKLLVSPFTAINDFSILFDSGLKLTGLDGRITSEEMLEAADWKLVSTLDEKGQINHEMLSRSGARFNFTGLWPEVFKKDKDVLPSCGPIRFEMYFYPRESVKELSLDKAQIIGFLDSNQGIRIYRDGFRVMPYGEPSGEGDWLSLALRRVRNPQGVRQPGKWYVGYNQVVGALFLERDKNSALLDQTNREGLVEEQAYYDLSKFAMHSIEFFENRRQIYERSQMRKTRVEKAREEAKASANAAQLATTQLRGEVEKVLEPIENKGVDTKTIRSSLYNSITLVEQAIVQATEAQEELGQATEEQQRDFEYQKDTLGNLASLGILAATFGHESLSHANMVMNNIALLKQNFESLPSLSTPAVYEKITGNISDIEYAGRRIETFAEFTLKNVRRDKRTRKPVYLDRVIKDVFSSFAEELKHTRGISISLKLPAQTPPISAFRIDWESIIINFITNAVWALENIPRAQRKIRVRLQKINNKLQLYFADSGCGIEAGTIDRIFEPTFSTKRNQRGEIIGTGMGLAIVENFVYSYGGIINVESPSDLGGAEFHIQITIPETRGRPRKI